MGTVYRARDRAQGGKLVAFKVHDAKGAISLQRFAREAELLAGLSHPNVVTYVAHGMMPGDRLYVAMEWVGGVTLAQRLDDRGLSTSEAIATTLQMANGLAYIHERGILHRDLKPSNVMLVGDQVKIIDFGLAREMRSAHKLTETGAAMGTPGYMSPEQVLGRKDLDVRSDLFAAGCLLYECLTGTPAFTGPTWVAVQTRILLKPVVPLSAHGIDVPDALVELLDSMLVKDAEARLPDVRALIAKLTALGPLDTSVRQTSRGPVASTRKTPPRWKFPAEPEYLVIALTDRDVERDEVAATVADLGGVVSRLAEGALIVRIEAQRDHAAVRAAHCALALRALSTTWPISIVDNQASGLDDATRELAADEIGAVFAPGAATIRLDEKTARLLQDEFEIRRDRIGFILAPR
jgi:serine/threonine protein kinase